MVGLAWPAAAAAVVDQASPQAESWRWLGAAGARGEGLQVLAESDRGDLAVGDGAGVSWWRGASRLRAALPPVHDLAFAADGVLWIATARGLHTWQRDDRPLRRTLRGGEASSRVHRIAVAGSAIVVATDGGAFWSSEGRIFQPLRVAGAATPVSRIAIQLEPPRLAEPFAAGAIAQVWLFGAGHLARVRGMPTPSGLRVIEARRMPLPGALGERVPADLAIGPLGEHLHLVFEDSVASRALTGGSDDDLAAGWQTLRPVLPPGAVIHRLGWAGRRVFLATDHGLLEGAALAGPFARVASSAGASDCVDVKAARAYSVLALCRQGLFALAAIEGTSARAVMGTPLSATPRPSSTLLPPDPPVQEIRRRALERSGLDVLRDRRLRKGLWRRAFWPEVELRFGADFDQDRSRDADQSFLSGDTRHLLDRTRDDGRRLSATVVLDWELGGIAYPEEAVDLSRELRQVVSLRDDVIDEINQLYFERQSIRDRLATPGAIAAVAEADRLRWRAREIDAGLDAWTGGWISSWRATRDARQHVRQDDSEGPDREERPDHPIHPDPTFERNER